VAQPSSLGGWCVEILYSRFFFRILSQRHENKGFLSGALSGQAKYLSEEQPLVSNIFTILAMRIFQYFSTCCFY